MPDITLPKPQPPLTPPTIVPPPNISSVAGGGMALPKPPAPEKPAIGLPKPINMGAPPVSLKPAVIGGVGSPLTPRSAPTPLRTPVAPLPTPAAAKPAGILTPQPGGLPVPPALVKPEDPSAKTTIPPQVAKSGSPMQKFLPFLIVGAVLLLLGIGAFFLYRNQGKTTSIAPNPANTVNPPTASTTPGRQTVSDQKITLTYWGLWEPSAVMEQIFAEFKQAHPGVEIAYQAQSHVDYRQRLQTAIAQGNGPDLFRYHASWVPMLSNELASLPSKVMTVGEFQQTFYPVAAQQLQFGGQIVGIPLMYDGLGLYYNTEVLSTAGVEVPKTWVDLKSLASRLTIRSGNEIKRAGLAIGNASTTEHFSDIIGLLMLQNGADPKDLATKEAQDAMVFYSNFVLKDQVWDEKLPTSTVAFARGDAAMMLAPSWRAHEVLAINPNLKFGISTVPTLGEQKIAWATYWAEGVNNKSKNQEMAWELIKYLSTPEVMKKMYAEQAKTRAFGEIYSRIDLADSLASDPYVAPFLADAPYAKGWYLSSFTHDKGLNDNLIKYYQDAVNALVLGKNLESTMETLSLGSQQILRQYKIQ